MFIVLKSISKPVDVVKILSVNLWAPQSSKWLNTNHCLNGVAVNKAHNETPVYWLQIPRCLSSVGISSEKV